MRQSRNFRLHNLPVLAGILVNLLLPTSNTSNEVSLPMLLGIAPSGKFGILEKRRAIPMHFLLFNDGMVEGSLILLSLDRFLVI